MKAMEAAKVLTLFRRLVPYYCGWPPHSRVLAVAVSGVVVVGAGA